MEKKYSFDTVLVFNYVICRTKRNLRRSRNKKEKTLKFQKTSFFVLEKKNINNNQET